MDVMTQEAVRVIIDDFSKAIESRKTEGPRPQTCVINFRDEQRTQYERKVYLVPTELLRYRKDNGRIASDVMNYERYKGVLDEKSKTAQEVIETFLNNKDLEKTEELMQSVLHSGQKEAAIITCDGFLINGNRRLMVLNELFKKTNDPKFQWMKVVVLPGRGNPGGPPTIREIEQIENRYQLQSEGKAEYTAFDKALSIRRKVKAGMSLEEQLKDDPTTAGLSRKEFEQKVREYRAKYLEPLKCIDEYLEHFDRPGLYGTIASGVGDPEGRWQAFVDYSLRLDRILSDPEARARHGIREDEVGRIKDVVFKIIRKRSFQDLPKLHKIIRDLPKYVSDRHAKEELLKIASIETTLPEKERVDSKNHPLDERESDLRWGEKHATILIRQVKRAIQIHTQREEREKPLDLLIGALAKLNNENMDIPAIEVFQLDDAMKYAKEIQQRAKEIESEIYHHQKELRQLKKQYSHKKNGDTD